MYAVIVSVDIFLIYVEVVYVKWVHLMSRAWTPLKRRRNETAGYVYV